MPDSDSTQVIKVGDELPVFHRVVDLPNWNRYAAVNDEFIPIHMDDGAGRDAGYETAFGMGNLHTSYLHAMLRGWLNGRGRVTKLEIQYRGPSLRGTTNRACGVVTSVEPVGDSDESIVGLDVWVEDADGTRLTPGQAEVVVSGGT